MRPTDDVTVSSVDTALQPAVARDQARALFGQTMGLVAVTAGLFALGAYLGRDLSYGWGFVFVHRELRRPDRHQLRRRALGAAGDRPALRLRRR